MAEMSLTDQESLSCSICLDLLNNPVTIPCGHSFCKDCINGLWDQNNDGGVYSCSQCKQTFTQRPSVFECVMLKELAEKLRRMKLQTQTDAEADDVRCDSCTPRRIEAIKSCLTCVSSYCDKHLEQHNELHMGKKHQLIDAADLQSKTCSHHGKLLEYFCYTDQQCICVLCVIDEHKEHDTISAADERAEKQRTLVETHKKFLQKIQDKEKDLNKLTKAEESIKHSAQTTITDNERIFAEVMSSIQRTGSCIKELITDKERAGLTHIEGLHKKIQQEIDDMRMKIFEIDQLMSTEDHVHFLLKCSSLCEAPISDSTADLYSISANPNVFFLKVMMLVYEMQSHLMIVSKETVVKISEEEVPASIPETTAFKLNFNFKSSDDESVIKPDFTLLKKKSEIGVPVSSGLSFADLAKSSGKLAIGQIGTVEQKTEDDGIHFEPIVSLPEVEVKSGEEDENILFKERTKLYRWDLEVNQWKERGVGDIKILFHPVKKCYCVFMRQDQILKVCANHTITRTTELTPMKTSANALVWTATDYSDGKAEVGQFAAKFKTPDLAESFRRIFTDCQSHLSQMSIVQRLSRATNPVVYLKIAVNDEPIGKITVKLFSHIVPKTAENFRALCTGEKGFGYLNSIFHRIIPDFICQGGDITNQDGTGGKSIYGRRFEDENFDVRHTGPGLLSMANRGRDTNNSQFFITLKKAEHLDFKHVAFGFVKDGIDVVKKMGELGTKEGKPSKKITIIECGQL